MFMFPGKPSILYLYRRYLSSSGFMVEVIVPHQVILFDVIVEGNKDAYEGGGLITASNNSIIYVAINYRVSSSSLLRAMLIVVGRFWLQRFYKYSKGLRMLASGIKERPWSGRSTTLTLMVFTVIQLRMVRVSLPL